MAGGTRKKIASRDARRTGGGCAGAGGRTRELVVQPRPDCVEAHVSHPAPRQAVFSVPGYPARVRHAPGVRRLERRRAPVRDGRLRRLVQPPPPQHLIRLGETLEEALDDDVPGRRHDRHAQHAPRHGGRVRANRARRRVPTRARWARGRPTSAGKSPLAVPRPIRRFTTRRFAP